ncbi:DoxX family protein [Prosthecomicrobium pneumaticum]|uniref:Putative oxidoreductase n=1 Tax=Prosthecomicrobium pneumaticum TaxID=81895 RepID=A0A7W9CVI7_9HYPH|nr:DoxX family protein [Prosthecomicrobium pneumaticum]MBB5752132.1 putative oxidoreductase [Prosthecomicrobium pneumaticum]
MSNLSAPALLVGRILIAAIFLISGFGKLMDPAGTAGYMSSVGLPGILVWPTIVVELLGGILIVVGYQTRIVALILAAFTLVAGLLFHLQPADMGQMINFWKNIAIVGGFLFLFAGGPGPLSIDRR